jgi:hypothetical protein
VSSLKDNPQSCRAAWVAARLGLLALVSFGGTDYYAEMLTRMMIMAILS